MLRSAAPQRVAIGFDHIFSMLDKLASENTPAYPPYDIERTGEDAYRITLAVAGFARDDLEVETHENILRISGKRPAEPAEGVVTLHRGIAARAFTRKFQLADYVETRSVRLENGLLVIELVRDVPEAKKARRIDIG